MSLSQDNEETALDESTVLGKGREVETNTFESKPGRPVHYFDEEDLRDHFQRFSVIENAIIEDPENHGEQGNHLHALRYIFARKVLNRL